MFDIISVGSGLVDAFVYAGLKEEKKRMSVPVGTKLLINKIDFSTGGGGTNSACCVSKLGLKTGFLGKVGHGYNAKIILRELRKCGVEFLGVSDNKKGVHTGYSIILEGDKKHRTILAFKGASDMLKFNEINLRKLKTKWFYFTSTGGETFKTQEKLAQWAAKNNVKVAYNPSSYQTRLGSKKIGNILKRTDFLSLNKEEARMLVNSGDLIKGLHKLGPKIVCITQGSKEGLVSDGNFIYRFKPKKIKFKECTGAGDAFASSFVAGLIKYNDIESAIKVALLNSESLIKKRGAKNGLLSWREIERKIKGGFSISKRQI